jgi:hypothetical protein
MKCCVIDIQAKHHSKSCMVEVIVDNPGEKRMHLAVVVEVEGRWWTWWDLFMNG